RAPLAQRPGCTSRHESDCRVFLHPSGAGGRTSGLVRLGGVTAAPPQGATAMGMSYIDPHIHMVSRTTDDYKRMALAGCVMASEPAFWAGFDRSGPEGFRDYFRQLTQYEPKRAGLYGIEHRCWLCINAKEAENVSLSREVIALIPNFLDRPNVLGIGEIGL